MGLLDRILRGAEFRSPSTLANPSADLIEAFAGGTSYSGKRVTVKGAFGLAPVWSAVSIIAETIGALPLKVYRTFDEDNRIEARDHRTWRMLHDAPNSAMPAHRFWSTVTAHLLLWGNAFLEKRRGLDGLVDELWLLDTSALNVEW